MSQFNVIANEPEMNISQPVDKMTLADKLDIAESTIATQQLQIDRMQHQMLQLMEQVATLVSNDMIRSGTLHENEFQYDYN